AERMRRAPGIGTHYSGCGKWLLPSEKSHRVAGAMQHTNDGHMVPGLTIIDHVIASRMAANTRLEFVAPASHSGRRPKRYELVRELINASAGSHGVVTRDVKTRSRPDPFPRRERPGPASLRLIPSVFQSCAPARFDPLRQLSQPGLIVIRKLAARQLLVRA